MEKLRKRIRGIGTHVRNDWNIVRARRLLGRGIRAAPSATARYVVDKVPVVRWISLYDSRWLKGDIASGTTVGLVLVLQAVNMATPLLPVGISIQQTLVANWLPGFVYAMTGTSKDISVGPTITSTMLTIPILQSISEATQLPPQAIMPALTLAVGLWSLVFGLLGLGVIFELIPVYFSLALVSALSAIVLILQLPILLGILNLPPNVREIPREIFKNTGEISARTVLISVFVIVVLGSLALVSGRWGREKTTRRGRLSRIAVATGPLMVIVVFLAVSMPLLKDLPIQQQVASFAPLAQPAGQGTLLGVGGSVPGLTNETRLPDAPPQAGLPQVTTNSTTSPATRSGMARISTALQGRSGTSLTAQRQTRGAQFPSGSVSSLNGVYPSRGLPARDSLPPNSSVDTGPGGSVSTANNTTAPQGGEGMQKSSALPFWAVFPEFTTEIPSPTIPFLSLAMRLVPSSLFMFVAINLEHIAIAKTFAHDTSYTPSTSQEMFSLGLINIINSLFGGVPVGGGDAARSSILAMTRAKSPLNQVFAALTVLAAMMPASSVLRFLPQAVLAAVIFVAVCCEMPSQFLVSTYYKLSLVDFAIFMLIANLPIPTRAGIGSVAAVAAGFLLLVLYTLLRSMWGSTPRILTTPDLERLLPASEEDLYLQGQVVPPGALVVKLDADMLWTNAETTRRRVLDAAYVGYSGRMQQQLGAEDEEEEQVWSAGPAAVDRRVSRARTRWLEQLGEPAAAAAAAAATTTLRPRLRTVVLDVTAVAFADSSAVLSLALLRRQLRGWAGDDVGFRFVGPNKHLRRRFARARWPLVDPRYESKVDFDDDDDNDDDAAGRRERDLVFDSLPQALRYMSRDVAFNAGGAFEISRPGEVSNAGFHFTFF